MAAYPQDSRWKGGKEQLVGSTASALDVQVPSKACRILPQQAQALDDGRLFGALTASGKSSSEGLREIPRFWVGHRFV